MGTRQAAGLHPIKCIDVGLVSRKKHRDAKVLWNCTCQSYQITCLKVFALANFFVNSTSS